MQVKQFLIHFLVKMMSNYMLIFIELTIKNLLVTSLI